MNISNSDIKILSEYICHCNDFHDKQIKDKIWIVLKNRLKQDIAIADSSDIDEEYFISEIFTIMGATYFYYEGIKKKFGFKNFLAHVKRREVLAVFASSNIDKILEKQNISKAKKCFLQIRYKENEFFINDQKITKRLLRKLYFNDNKIISNACFMLDRIEKEEIIANIKKHLEFEKSMIK